MSAGGVVVISLGGLVLLLLLAGVTWNFVFSNVDRGMVKMMWGTLTGTGSFGGQ